MLLHPSRVVQCHPQPNKELSDYNKAEFDMDGNQFDWYSYIHELRIRADHYLWIPQIYSHKRTELKAFAITAASTREWYQDVVFLKRIPQPMTRITYEHCVAVTFYIRQDFEEPGLHTFTTLVSCYKQPFQMLETYV